MRDDATRNVWDLKKQNLWAIRTEPSREIVRGPNFRIVLFWVRDEREGPIAVKDRRLGTDRRRSRQRTVFVSDVSYATVYLVRHALAGIERAT